MGVMLDLSMYQEETADIKMTNGAVLHLKKPTEKMVIHMVQLKSVSDDTPALEVLATLNRIALEILNNNADGLKFTMQNVAEMSTGMKTEILTAYSDWAVKLQGNPTVSYPESGKTGNPEKRQTGKSRGRFMRWRNTAE